MSNVEIRPLGPAQEVFAGEPVTWDWERADEESFLAVDVDLDIDSDNNNLINSTGTFDPPDESVIEEAMEDAPGHPGKAIALNELDTDTDGVPDYADGYNIMLPTILSPTVAVDQSGADKSRRFVPLVLRVSKAVDWSVATVRFASSAGVNLLSDPAAVAPSTSAPFTYTVTDGGKYRMWLKKDGSLARGKAPVPAGDAILKDTAITISDLGPDADGKVKYLYLEALPGSASVTLGDIKLKVDLDPDGSGSAAADTASDQVKATAFHVETVHPIADDFDQKVGAVLISTKQDQDKDTAYHTTAITTVAGKKAQSEDAKVTISAYVVPIPPPPSQYPNLRVFFEVTDPDDLSHYEGKTVGANGRVTPPLPDQGNKNPNDNRDPGKKMTWGATPVGYPAYQTACLTAQSAPVQSPVTIPPAPAPGGVVRAVAETTLKITEQYSGDNYQVRATMQDPRVGGSAVVPFDARSGMTAVSGNAPNVRTTVKESEKLIAWKRVYIHKDRMLKKGCTIIIGSGQMPAEPGRPPLPNPRPHMLCVDDNSDFNAGDRVCVWYPAAELPPEPFSGDYCDNIVTLTTTVKCKGDNIHELWLNDVPDFWGCAANAGVRFADDTGDSFDVNESWLPIAFGDDSDGSDGGAFIEFNDMPWLTDEDGHNLNAKLEDRFVPKFSKVSNADEIKSFLNFWRYHMRSTLTRADNIIYAVAGKAATGLGGICFPPEGELIVFTESTVEPRHTLVHEVGHWFEIVYKPGTRFSYVDVATDVFRHDYVGGTPKKICVMSYKSDPKVAPEFSVHALLKGSVDGAMDSLRDRPDN